MNAGPLVSAERLAARLGEPGLVVVDCRWNLEGPTPSEIYEQGHIAGAVLVDLDTDLAGQPGRQGGHPLPSPSAFAAAMRKVGISDDSHVIAYGHNGGVTAARLWWMLDSLGVSCSVMDGGFAAWCGPVEQGPARPVASGSFTERPFPANRFATADEVADRASDVTLIDARPRDRFDGAPGGDYPRYGHIPGAVNVFAYDSFAGRDEPCCVSRKDDLAALYRSVGLTDSEQPVIAYCGSGVSACATLLGLRVLGFENLRLYTGSFSEWARDPARPVETVSG